MRTLLMGLTLGLVTACAAQAQDPGMMAAQQSQMAAQAAQQAMQAAQIANQNTMNAQQQAVQNAQCYPCGEATPKFSVKPGQYSSPVTVKIKDAGRGAVIYYTTDGWTPTAASTRYTGPVTIDSTTTLQAIAISPYGGRSRVAIAAYTWNGVPPALSVAPSPQAAPNSAWDSAAVSASSARLLLAHGTAVPLVFASELSSKTAEVGDKISMTLAEDLKAAGDVVVVKKGTQTVATVTEVDKPHMGGVPGEVFFQVDSIQSDGTVIKLRGSAAKEGQDKVTKATALVVVPVVPVALLVHGKDADIKPGTTFTAFVDLDTLLPPAN